jgi:hypothetical protein
MAKASDYFRATFGLDLRSLAAMRIGLAGVLLTDLAIRFSDFRAMYSSAGFAPVDMVRQLQRIPAWSLHLLSGSDAWQMALFAVAALGGGAMLLGYHTRWAVIASWVLLTSVQVRAPLTLNAGDTLLRVALFWSMFLPLGAVWSVDALRRRAGRRDQPSGSSATQRPSDDSNPFVSAATFALIVQLALVYWFAGWAKWNDAWLHEDALANVFKFGLYGLPLGAALVDYPSLTLALSRATVWFELIGPLLLFIPWQAARLRMVAFIGFVLLHAGIAVTMTVGLFSYAAIAVWVGILPSRFWDRWPALRFDDATSSAGLNLPAAESAWRRRVSATVVLACLAIAVYWNVASAISPRAVHPIDRALRTTAHLTTLRQGWGVFGKPPRRDSWFVYQARLKNGDVVDLLSGSDQILTERPALASRQFDNHRWRKLHLRLRSDEMQPYRQSLAEYMCREWNAAHDPDEQVTRVDFYCYTQSFDLAGNPGDHARKTLARVVLSNEGGNFAEALRSGEAF